MGKRLAALAIRLLVSLNLLYAAIFLKFAGVPGSVALFNQMSQAVHGLVSQPVFRLGSGMFETVVAVALLIPKSARLGARLTVLWMTAVLISHILVLGYGWFFVDALIVMLLAVIYLLLTRRLSKLLRFVLRRFDHSFSPFNGRPADTQVTGNLVAGIAWIGPLSFRH